MPITLHVTEARTTKDRLIGLLRYEKPVAMLFKTRFGIHTFGMRFPIDVIVLDRELNVVRSISYLQPNRIFLWQPIYNLVIELPAGTIQKKHIETQKKVRLHYM
jgi:uncharacterized protein